VRQVGYCVGESEGSSVLTTANEHPEAVIHSESPGTSISVGLLEDHQVTREALGDFLGTHGFQVTCSSSDPQRFLVEMRASCASVAVVDLTIQELHATVIEDGFFVLRELRACFPGVRTLVFSAEMDPKVVERCYAEGASGYLFKVSTGCEEVAEALRRIAAGERIFPLQITSRPEQGELREPEPEMLARLTPREREILAYVAAGADNLKIAVLAHISERTVKAHVSNLYRKLEVENRTQLAIRARELGIRAHPGV
jgi:two-component system, NarL family, nitrate/nitrite response regulator NarL